MKKIKILLADDHPIFLDGLATLLDSKPDIEVVSKVNSGQDAVIMSSAPHQVDIAILDIRMPILDGIEAARQIYKIAPNVKVILLTMLDDAHFIAKAYHKGIHGYVLKEKSTETLISAIHSVALGNSYWPSEYIDLIRQENVRQNTVENEVNLTIREKELLCLLATNPGLSNRELGTLVHIAEFTIQTHLQNVRKKLGAKTRGELIKYTLEMGFCKDT